jgi:subtilisin family serine protease
MENSLKPYSKLFLTLFFCILASASFVNAYISSPNDPSFLDSSKFFSSPLIEKLLDKYPTGFVPLPLKAEDNFLANNYSETGGYIIEYTEDPLAYNTNRLFSQGTSKTALKAQTKEIVNKRSIIQSAHASLKSQIKSMDLSGHINREYERVFNGVSVWNMSSEDIIRISMLKGVKMIYPIKNVSILLSDSVPMIGTNDAWKQKDPFGNSLTGKGMKIAIIDTGIDYTHPDLGGCSMGNIEGDTLDISGNNYSLESDHPYVSKANQTWNISVPGYEKISVHFDRIRLEDGFDVLSIRNSSGETVQELTGSLDDVWSLSVEGDALFITLTSDKDVEDWGFSVDMILNGSADLSGAGCTKVIGGYDYISNDNNPMDDHGHGTHCAATAAGNGLLKGVAPDAKLLAYKVLDSYGGGYDDDIIAAIERAVADEADVISMSLGGDGDPWDAMSKAVDNAADSGTLVVVAAGNSGPRNRTVSSPGCAIKALTVGAVYKNEDLKRPRVSNVSLVSSTGFQINSTAFDYSAITPSGGIAGELIFASSGETTDYAGKNVAGKIVLLRTMFSRIFFEDQIANAYKAGASGVIIYNNEEDYDDDWISWTLSNFSSVPAVGIGKYTGQYLRNLVSNGTAYIRIYVGIDPDLVVYFSSRGPAYLFNKPDLLAPGVNVCAASMILIPEKYNSRACIDNRHILMSGTSMATPHVAGAAALLKQKNPSWSALEIKAALEETSDDLGLDANIQGAGLINISAAATLLSAPPAAYLTNISKMNITDEKEVYVYGLVNISGFAVGKNINRYSLEYMQSEGTSGWVSFADETITQGIFLEDESILAAWNTSGIPEGPYVIRLNVTDSDGRIGSDLAYVRAGLSELNTSYLCPRWSCDGLVEGKNTVNISLTQEQYKSRMKCSIDCSCPENSYATVYSSGDIENFFDRLIVRSLDDAGGFLLTGRWNVNDSLKGLVPLTSNKAGFRFTSDTSIDGSNGYTGFNVEQIVCQPYCNSYSADSNGEYIAKIRLADARSQSANNSYIDNTASVLAKIRAGKNYTLEVDIRTNNKEKRNEVAVAWIDFDRDKAYNNSYTSPERIALGSVNISSGVHSFQKEFTVPKDMRVGTTRMRVSLGGYDITDNCSYSEDLCEMMENYSASPVPCGRIDEGAVQDYTVEIVKSECGLLGDMDPCGVVSIEEVMDVMILWQQEKASLRDVIEIINLWSRT